MGAEFLVGAMVLSMVAVLMVAWRWFGSFRTAFMVMLITGKVWATVLWAFGVDRPLFNIVLYNKVRGTYTAFTVTADGLIFLSFLVTLISTAAWPWVAPHLPKELRRMGVVPRD